MRQPFKTSSLPSSQVSAEIVQARRLGSVRSNRPYLVVPQSDFSRLKKSLTKQVRYTMARDLSRLPTVSADDLINKITFTRAIRRHRSDTTFDIDPVYLGGIGTPLQGNPVAAIAKLVSRNMFANKVADKVVAATEESGSAKVDENKSSWDATSLSTLTSPPGNSSWTLAFRLTPSILTGCAWEARDSIRAHRSLAGDPAHAVLGTCPTVFLDEYGHVVFSPVPYIAPMLAGSIGSFFKSIGTGIANVAKGVASAVSKVANGPVGSVLKLIPGVGNVVSAIGSVSGVADAVLNPTPASDPQTTIQAVDEIEQAAGSSLPVTSIRQLEEIKSAAASDLSTQTTSITDQASVMAPNQLAAPTPDELAADLIRQRLSSAQAQNEVSLANAPLSRVLGGEPMTQAAALGDRVMAALSNTAITLADLSTQKGAELKAWTLTDRGYELAPYIAEDKIAPAITAALQAATMLNSAAASPIDLAHPVSLDQARPALTPVIGALVLFGDEANALSSAVSPAQRQDTLERLSSGVHRNIAASLEAAVRAGSPPSLAAVISAIMIGISQRNEGAATQGMLDALAELSAIGGEVLSSSSAFRITAADVYMLPPLAMLTTIAQDSSVWMPSSVSLTPEERAHLESGQGWLEKQSESMVARLVSLVESDEDRVYLLKAFREAGVPADRLDSVLAILQSYRAEKEKEESSAASKVGKAIGTGVLDFAKGLIGL